jgi:hypothetical protein
VNPTRTRKRIRELARAGAWTMTAHAENCRAVRQGCWRLDGGDRPAEPLSLLVELRAGGLVVTLVRGDEP